jgi:hypothetical protein
MCPDCGGQPEYPMNDWKHYGEAARMFYEARFEVLRRNLSPESRDRFNAMPLERQIGVVGRLIEKGAMI